MSPVPPERDSGRWRSHHGCGRGCRLRSHGRLVGLVLGGLDLGLQVCRGVKVLALLARAAALDVVHAHGDRVVAGVDHGAVARVSEAAVRLAAGAVAPLELAADLGEDTEKTRMTDKGWHWLNGTLKPFFLLHKQ